MWAIKNKHTNEWVYGTCFGYPKNTQRTSNEKAMLFEDEREVLTEFERRDCGGDFEICEVKLVVTAIMT